MRPTSWVLSLTSLAAIAVVAGIWCRSYMTSDTVIIQPLFGFRAFVETARGRATFGIECDVGGGPLPGWGGRFSYVQRSASVPGSIGRGGLKTYRRSWNANWAWAIEMVDEWPLAAALVFALLATVASNRIRQWRAGHCQQCGYDLRGSPGRCPECGTVPT